jgi:hypothetical protein
VPTNEPFFVNALNEPEPAGADEQYVRQRQL